MDLAFPSNSGRIRPMARSTSRLVTAWMAVFCLYVQLVAAGACLAGSPLPGLSAGIPPICHSQVASPDPAGLDNPNGAPHGVPDRSACPFCILHCHGVLAGAAPALGLAAPVSVVAANLPSRAVVVPARARRIAGPSPRGPPSA